MAKDVSMFDEEGAAHAAPTSLAELMKLAARAEALEKSVAELEDALKQQKSALLFLKTQTLPDAMMEAGLTKFTSTSGAELSIHDYVGGSLPKEPEPRRAAFNELLKDKEGTAIIRNTVSVEFPRSKHNEAAALADTIRAMGFDVAMNSDVNHMTLGAYVREKLKNGDSVNYEVLGCYVGKTTKIKLPETAGPNTPAQA